MGTNLPYGRRKTLKWLEAHIDDWAADPAAIGLTSAQVADLQADIASTRDTFTHMHEMRFGAQSATLSFNRSADGLHTKAADLIMAIKGFAASSGSSGAIYAAASLSPKGTPSPAPAPAAPTNLAAQLIPGGDLLLSWEGSGPTGTLYEVYRKLSGQTEHVMLGNVDARTKHYRDASLPVGTTQATYMIRAIRGAKASTNSGQLAVQFGPTAPAARASGQLGEAA